MTHKNIHKTFLFKDIIVILAVLAVGAAFLPFDSWGLIIGLCIIICGVCMLPFYIHGYKIEGAHGVFHEKSIAVSKDDKDKIISFLQGESSSPDFKTKEDGGALISIFYQKNTEVVYAQFYEYSQVMEGKTLPLQKITTEQKESLLKL